MNFDLRHKLGCALAILFLVGYCLGIEAAAIILFSYIAGFTCPFFDSKDKN